MKIGIIGAGNIGKVLSTELVKLKHEVYVANSRGPETLAQFGQETGAKPVSVFEAVSSGQSVIIITIPFVNTKELPKDLFEHISNEVILVDTGNYYPGFRDGVIEEIENGMRESEWVEKRIGRPVIKAFNNIFANSLATLGSPASDINDRVVLSVSGDDYRKKTVVMNLINDLGFTPFDQGSIKDSWKQQPGSPLYCTDLKKEQLIKALASMPASYDAEVRKIFADDRDTKARKYM